MNYLSLLQHSYEIGNDPDCPETPAGYLSEFIFDFDTYDGEMSDLFGKKAVEVCLSLSNGTTYEYIKDKENYKWYLLLLNTPFFRNNVEWGSSIRNAWWATYKKPNKKFLLESTGLYKGDEQILEFLLTEEQWKDFIEAMCALITET